MRTPTKAPIDWLFPMVRQRVLSLLLARPGERWHLREIARRAGCALGTVRRELSGLANAEIVVSVKDGNRTYYQANSDCPLFAELSGLIRKTVGLADVLREALAPLAEAIRVAFVYGSQASGEVKAGSDVDVLVVGKVTLAQVVSALGPAQESLGREINPSVYPTREFTAKLAKGDHFLETVLSGPKVFVIGGKCELAGLAEPGMALQ